MRVVSLVPSVTETLLAWGIRPLACTRFCEQPGLTTVGGTKTPDIAAIVALGPDLVVMDEEENRIEDHAALQAAGVPVHVLAVRSVADVAEQLPALAERLGVSWTAPAMPPAPEPAVRAVVPIWRRPWMVLGRATYGGSLLACLGVAVVSPAGRGPYAEVSAEELRTLGSADVGGAQHGRGAGDDGSGADGGAGAVVLAPSEPYPFGPRHRDELEQAGPVAFVDGKDLFWWGVRTAGAHERLGRTLAAATGGRPPALAGGRHARVPARRRA